MPFQRVIQEIWRASQSQPNPLTQYLSGPSIFLCYQAVKESENSSQAISRTRQALFETKANSVVTELARRAAIQAFHSDKPHEAWRAALFSQVTDYLVSRDVSGYVGDRFRNRTIPDIIEFKATLLNQVREIVSGIRDDPGSPESWSRFVQSAVSALTGETSAGFRRSE